MLFVNFCFTYQIAYLLNLVSTLHSVPFTLLFKLPQVERFSIKDWDIRVPRFSIIYLQAKSYASIKPSPRFEILLSLGRVLDYLFVTTITRAGSTQLGALGQKFFFLLSKIYIEIIFKIFLKFNQ